MSRRTRRHNRKFTAEICRLVRSGKTMRAIGETVGLSRNACIGIWHRNRERGEFAPCIMKARLLQPRGIPMSLVWPPSGCCLWLSGEPGSPVYRFCGKTAARLRPYCSAHQKAAYVKPGPSVKASSPKVSTIQLRAGVSRNLMVE